MKCTPVDRGRSQRGSAILMSVVLLVLLVAAGSALLFVGQNELSLSRSGNDEREAFHLADAAVEAARMALYDLNGTGKSLNDDLTTAAGADGTVSLNPGMVRPVFNGSGAVTGLLGVGDDVPVIPLTTLSDSSGQGGQFAAFLTNDPVESIGNQTDLNGRVMITGIGISRNGSSEVAQAIIEPVSLLPPIPPAAITLIGPAPVFDNGNSNAQNHSGADCPTGGGNPGLNLPIIGTTSPAAKAQVEGDMSNPANFHSGGLSGQDTVADLTSPSDPAMAQSGVLPIDPAWTDCAQLAQYVQELILMADFYCNTDIAGSCNVPPGTTGDIMVVDGNASAGNFNAGILLVTGTLSYNGNSAWNGLVFAIGEGRVTRNGGGNGHNTGSMVVANVDPSPSGPRADKSDWCSSGLNAPEFTVSGAGSSTLSYCSDQVELNNPVETYRVAQFLQQ